MYVFSLIVIVFGRLIDRRNLILGNRRIKLIVVNGGEYPSNSGTTRITTDAGLAVNCNVFIAIMK